MRQLFILLLFVYCGLAFGQNENSLSNLELKATTYLNTMYKDCDFVKAQKEWDDSMVLGLKEFYSKRKLTFENNNALIDHAKKHAITYCKSHSGFVILKFLNKKMTTENGKKIALFQYSYSETIENETNKNTEYISFVFNKSKMIWQVVDYRFTKIIADNWD